MTTLICSHDWADSGMTLCPLCGARRGDTDPLTARARRFDPIGADPTDAAFVAAFLSGAESFTPDGTTEPYCRHGIRTAVLEILAEYGVEEEEPHHHAYDYSRSTFICRECTVREGRPFDADFCERGTRP